MGHPFNLSITVWGGVADAIHSSSELDFHFPNHEQQQEIATGFCSRSGAGFDNAVGAIDDLIVCTLMPYLSECQFMNADSPFCH